MALRGVCSGPGLVSDCFLVSDWFVLVRNRFRWVLGGACAPKNQSEWVSNPKKQSETPKNNLKPNPVQNRPPVKPTLCLTGALSLWVLKLAPRAGEVADGSIPDQPAVWGPSTELERLPILCYTIVLPGWKSAWPVSRGPGANFGQKLAQNSKQEI